MKKSVGAFFVLCLIGLLGFVTSCIVDDDDDDEITKPTVYRGTDAIYISFNSIEGMKYANVFRKKVTDSNWTNIGQVTPANVNNLPNSFTFVDKYIGDEKTEYKYCIRYYNGAYPEYTNESSTINGITSDEEDEEVETREIVLEFDNDAQGKVPIHYVEDKTDNAAYYLVLCSEANDKVNYSIETDSFSLYYVIKNTISNTTKPFKIPDDQLFPPPDLRLFLPSSYLGVPLTISSLIGVEELETEEINGYKCFYWTPELYVSLTQITVDAETTSFPTPKKISSFTVPTITDEPNDLDHSSYSRSLFAYDGETVLDVTPYQP